MRLFIVDESELVLERLKIYLTSVDGVELIGVAGKAVPNMNGISRLETDAVLLSIGCAARDELDFIRSLKKVSPAPLIVVLTNSPSPESMAEFTLTGADYFLDKTFEIDRIPEALGLFLRSYSEP